MKKGYFFSAVSALSVALMCGQVSVSLAESALSASQTDRYKQAKAAGQLVEKGDGYLKPGSGADAALIALMEQVNRLRKAKYQDVAQKTGAPIQAVESAAGAKLAD
ncbi:MAG: DUF1318 domain-containing protein [Magnetococcales bacterium]|nr:DUF1318 domain-containing protein [Magnetococcales bacterium]